MQVSLPNEHGVLEAGLHETVAAHGRAYCAVKIALCEDGLFRFGADMMYSHGGYFSPICVGSDGFHSLEAARTAALVTLLDRWHTPFTSDPASVHEELQTMRQQVEARLSRPLLL